MRAVILTLIIIGALNMARNIWSYFQFLKSIQDVLSSGRKRDIFTEQVAMVFLVFFMIGYIFAAFLSSPTLLVALILFFGSIFVSLVEVLMFRLLETAKERALNITEVLVGIIDARDPYLNGHSRHVQNLTMTLYRHLPKQMKKDINPVSLEYAALLHDVGKLGVPEAILNKPAALDPEEWEVIFTHPRVGVQILKPLHSFDTISNWILYHHERVDGSGYDKLRGDQIPLPARIIALTDTYSAITMRRSYKEPKTHEEAIAIMQKVAGAQLDRDLLDIFISIQKEELDQCIPEQVGY